MVMTAPFSFLRTCNLPASPRVVPTTNYRYTGGYDWKNATAEPCPNRGSLRPEVGRARGILRRPLPAGKLAHARRSPPPDLAYWIAHYWRITWDLRGHAPHLVENLPHPNIHV